MNHFLERIKRIKPLRSLIYSILGLITYPGFAIVNRLKISGTENIAKLPLKNVLFVSNHQTYFADVMMFLHIFCAVKWGKQNKLGFPFYVLKPFTNVYFIAAEETLNGSFLGRFFKLAGALTIKRTWRNKDQAVQRPVDPNDTLKIEKALSKSWVITFPQGTTKPFAPGRKGTAHIIKKNQPIVIPVVINGFWRAFTKKGINFKKKGSLLSIRFKPPMEIDYEQPTEAILEQVMDAIEQSKKFMR